MRIRILSDLHLERTGFTPPALSADVVVLAGDIAAGPKQGVRWARRHFAGTPVVMVAGNHEFYGGHLNATLGAMQVAAREVPDVHMLENDEIVIGDVRFLGATLWTDFSLFGRHASAKVKDACATWINDFRAIEVGTGRRNRLFTPGDAARLHRQSVGWLKARLKERFTGRTVVVTHHAPHPKSIAAQYARDLCTGAFVSDLGHLVGPPVDLWIHGHTHTGFDYQVQGTRVVCNPRGYAPYERVPGFDPALVVEL